VLLAEELSPIDLLSLRYLRRLEIERRTEREGNREGRSQEIPLAVRANLPSSPCSAGAPQKVPVSPSCVVRSGDQYRFCDLWPAVLGALGCTYVIPIELIEERRSRKKGRRRYFGSYNAFMTSCIA
jgi:hypothetical protein